ncbi:hypothetical protein [Cupriavidus sp. UYPR2.512]|uniref:hypothetical protein n=1 Tax=Cupriavidus sp. UYPR2.512 TaxID=1080187 RepID=UPI0012FCEAB3|nr:hypothetical protein [Cupriavidus sp. UYPR2.512]UIF89449.1 hypothetical protein KAF44_29720 [Cupriavidus necator]
MTVFFAIAIVLVLIVGVRAGTASSRSDEESKAPVCALCRTYLPCNCIREHEDTSYGHDHRHDQW